MNGKKVTQKITWICIGILVIGSWICTGIFVSKYNKLRGLHNQYGEQLYQAGRDYSELNGRLESIRNEVTELGELTDRNIKTARDAIELIEEIRGKVLSLETYCGDFDWSEYYQYWDSYLEIE